MKQGDLDYELQMFQAMRLSKLEFQKQEAEKHKRINLLSLQVLDCLSAVLVPKCNSCSQSKLKSFCGHWYPEDLLPFWKLRSVCKTWKQKVEEWLVTRQIVLMYNREEKPKTLEIIEEIWEIEAVNSMTFGNSKTHYIPKRKTVKRTLNLSNKWLLFLKHCEFYGIRNNITPGDVEVPLLSKQDAEERIHQLQVTRNKKDYRRFQKTERHRAKLR